MDINKIITESITNNNKELYRNHIKEIEKEYNNCIDNYNSEIKTCRIYKNEDLCKDFTFNNFKYCIFNIKK